MNTKLTDTQRKVLGKLADAYPQPIRYYSMLSASGRGMKKVMDNLEKRALVYYVNGEGWRLTAAGLRDCGLSVGLIAAIGVPQVVEAAPENREAMTEAVTWKAADLKTFPTIEVTELIARLEREIGVLRALISPMLRYINALEKRYGYNAEMSDILARAAKVVALNAAPVKEE